MGHLGYRRDSFAVTVAPDQHFQHVHHTALLTVRSLLQGLLKVRGDSQVHGLGFVSEKRTH